MFREYLIIGLVVFLASGFALIWLLANSGKALKKSRSNLAHRSCPGCGKSLGDSVARSAEDGWTAHSSTVKRDNPKMKFSLNPSWLVKCDKCNWKGRYIPSKEELF